MLSSLAILGAGAMNSAAAVQNNQRNIDFQREANDTQVELSNTAHQREVHDLIAAGLNPVLSASGSGASVPQLGVPSLDNPAEGLSSSIQSAAKMQALDVPLKQSQLLINSATAHNLMAQGKLYDAQADAVNAVQQMQGPLSEIATGFGDWLGKKWASLFGEKTPEQMGMSQRTIDWLLQQDSDRQEQFLNDLHKLRKMRGLDK